MEEKIALLRRIMKSGSPILFTGAGFNIGALRSDGKPIPMGKDLKRNILLDILGYEEGSDDYTELINESLTDVCDLCEQNNKARLEDYMTEVFSNCQPASYHRTIASYRWQKIYTTNIDDLLENTYPPGKLIVQNMERTKTVPKHNKMEYIKLHGCVRNQSQSYVFSKKSYVDSMLQSRDYRFNQFGQDIQYCNFIFIGTNYDEIDLDFYLQMYENSASVSGKGIIIFINPHASIVLKRKIDKYHGKLIEWTTEEFATFIESNQLIDKEKQLIPKLDSFYSLNLHVNKVKCDKSYRSNLYLGFEPTWKDIVKDWDFQYYQLLQNFSQFRREESKMHISHAVYSVIGKAMSGKSIFLKRLGYILYQKGFLVLEYTGKDLNYFSIINYCKYNEVDKLCLIVDDGSFYYGVFKSLLHNMSDNCELIILTASRPYYHSRKLYNIVTENYYEFTIPNGIDERFAEKIEETLFEKGFLGTLKKLEKTERIKSISRCNDIPNLLYNITYGHGFVKKFRDTLDEQIPSMTDEGKNLLLILSIFEKLELPYFPLEIVTLLYQAKTKATLKQVDDFVKYDKANGISLRNSNIASMIINKREPKKILSRIKDILINISPQVNEGAHTYWNEIEASLMKEKLLRQKLGLRTSAIKNMLFEIQDYYNDSYNYWIQMGISEQMDNEFDKALNHFKQAEAINPDSYMVQNAIARNFLKQANGFNTYDTALPYFERGEELILSLIKEREEFQVKAYSTHCYLYEKMNFYLRFGISPKDDELNVMYKMLKSIINKTSEEDGMSKHISNKFYSFLQKYGKTNIIQVQFHDLSELKLLMSDTGMDSDMLFEDFEIDD